MRSILLILLASASALAADLADPNAFPRLPGTDVGVVYKTTTIGTVVGGGIPAPETRGTAGGYTTHDVTASPYFASASQVETTGTITTGTDSLVVASATSFAVGQGIKVGLVAIQEITVTDGAGGDGNIRIDLAFGAGDGTSTILVAVANGDTAAQVAAKIRASSSFPTWWTVSGSGAVVRFTEVTVGPRSLAVLYDNVSFLGVAGTSAHIQTGVIAANTTITGISGTTFTLAANASSSVTAGIVSHNDSAAIQAAVNAFTPGDVIYLPAGTYRMDDTVNVIGNRDNITIRGAGETTIIHAYCAPVFSVGSTTTYLWGNPDSAFPVADNIVTAGMTAGSTVLTIADTTPFVAGELIQIVIENQMDDTAIEAGAIPVIGVGSNHDNLRRQLSRIESKTGTTLTIFPAVHFTPDAGLEVKVNHDQFHDWLEGFGLEDLWIKGNFTRMSTGVTFSQCYNSWVKGVRVEKTSNYGITFQSCLNFEARKNYVHDRQSSGSNGAGFLLNQVGQGLFEDNILVRVFPPVEINSSTTGTVFAYNFLYNTVGGVMNVNHGPHNSFNLYEGNISSDIVSDGYFGGSSNCTFFRNWLTGTQFEDADAITAIFALKRFTRHYAAIGNILAQPAWTYPDSTNPYNLGEPNIGNTESTGTAQPSSGDFWSHWKTTATLSTRTSDSAGVITVSVGEVDATASPSFPHYLHLVDPVDGTEIALVQAYSQTGSDISFQSSNAVLPDEDTALLVYWGQQGYQELDRDVFWENDPSFPGTTILKANYWAATPHGAAIPAG
jgi:hypothetical protein